MPTTLSRPVSELFPRVLALVKARRTEYAEATMRIPMANYRDSGVFQAELRHVLGASPLAIVPSAAIRGEGDYLTRQLPDRRSVVVARGQDGIARVLVNTCRHRGARVADGSGCTRRFTCPYHGWSYDTTGALVGQPGRPGFGDVDPADLGLTELASEESFGFVWLVPAGSPGVTAHLGTFAEHLASYDYASFQANPPMEVELPANWKCLLEAFYETYHFPFVHANSMVGQGTVPNIVSFDAFGAHARLGVPGATMQNLPEDATAEDFHMSVLYFVYPNLIIANTVLGCELIDMRPGDAPNRSVLRHTFLSKVDPALVSPRSNEEYLKAIRAIVRDEDGPVISSSGGGIEDAAHDFVLLGRNEPGCQHIHQQIAAALERAEHPRWAPGLAATPM
jgi:choline monooxygenase